MPFPAISANIAPTPRGSWAPVISWLEAVWGSWTSMRFAWPGTRCAPLVERIELEDRDVYRLLSGVSLRRTWAGAYSILVNLPGIDPSELAISVLDRRLVLEVGNGSNATTCTGGGRRSYSFLLPSDCDPTTLEARVGDEAILIAGRTIGKQAIGALRTPPPMGTLRGRWSAA
jgi:hypothetical protein